MSIRLKEYELYCRENELAPNTLKNYLNTLEQLERYIQKREIKVLSKENMIEFKDHLRNNEYAPGKKYKLDTCNQKITAINIYFNWSDEKHLVLKPFKVQTNNHRESINQSEFKSLLKYSDPEIKLFILVIGNTGLRISEVCALKKLNLYQSIIEVDNKGKVRVIDIPRFLKTALKTHMKDKEEGDLIFPKTQNSYRNRLKTAAGRARIKKSKVYPHSIRHYFSKQFINNGGDSTELQQMLGHSNIATTTIYTRMNKEELAKKFRNTRNK